MKRLTLALGSIGLTLALGFLTSVNAQNAPQPQSPAPAEHGMMGGMGMNGGMGMMEQMKRMMDQCERMMQGREQQHAPTDRPPG
jgi:hypothetical protein